MRLVELFTRTRDIEWEDNYDFYEARFNTADGKEYRIIFFDEPLRALKLSAMDMPDVMKTLNEIPEDAKITKVEFSLQGDGFGMDTKYGKTGTGNQYVVFATVIDAMKTYTQKFGYDHIRIVAEEPNRQRLYRRMIKAMPHKRVYENQDPMDGQVAFIVEL